jgi:hypothetical protein
MSNYDEAARLLAERITDKTLVGAEVDREPRKTSFVLSVRMLAGLAQRLFAEAERRRVIPSQLNRELVEAGLSATDKAATVNLADVHRAIDSLTRGNSV